MIDCSPKLQKHNDTMLGSSGMPPVMQEKFLCECIVCGYTAEYDVHCRDIPCPRCGGTMRRYERPGPGQPRGLAVASPAAVVDTYEGILATVLALEATMTRKELQYNGARGAIPVSKVYLGQRGLVHIYGEYEAPGAKQMSIRWTVRDPDGLLVESYYDADTWPYTPPGSEHHFVGDSFDLNKPGDWTIKAELLI